MTTVSITINGQPIAAQTGQTVLQAAQTAGIDIPALCHHPAVSSWGACRICLVEIARQRGLQPACTFPIGEGMEVWTETERVVENRKFVLQLLFSERNHYCMYCQMTGDCELQRLAYRYGMDHWLYQRPAERLPLDASRKYFVMEPNRCILCRRCVRVCGEVAASHTLGVRARGSHSMIIADHDVPFGESTCVECGCCLQVCPTGALMDRRSAYAGREEYVERTKTTCTQCSVGCTLDVVSRDGRLLRVEGAWGDGPSQGLLCVAGRFEPLYDTRSRVTTPLLRRDDKLEPATWDEAMGAIAAKMRGGFSVGLASGAATNETLAAFADLFEKVGGKAGRLEPAAPTLGFGQPAQIADVLAADLIVIAGVDPLAEERVVGYFAKRAMDKGARLVTIGDVGEMESYAILAASEADAGRAVELALNAMQPVVVYGLGLKPAVIDALRPLAGKALFLALDPAPNGQGALAAGLQPIPLTSADVHYLLLGESKNEAHFPPKNGAFTVVQASYRSAIVEQADVVLPATIWAEQQGHTTNLEGIVSEVIPIMQPPAGVRDMGDVLRSLAEMI